MINPSQLIIQAQQQQQQQDPQHQQMHLPQQQLPHYVQAQNVVLDPYQLAPQPMQQQQLHQHQTNFSNQLQYQPVDDHMVQQQQQHQHQHQHQLQQQQHMYYQQQQQTCIQSQIPTMALDFEQLNQQEFESITKQLLELKQTSNNLLHDSNRCRHKSDELNLALQQRSSIISRAPQLEQKDAQAFDRNRRERLVIEDSIKGLISDINDYRVELIERLTSIYNKVNAIQADIIYERLPAWRLEQQIQSNNVTTYTNNNASNTSSNNSNPQTSSSNTNSNNDTDMAESQSNSTNNNILDQYQVCIELIIDILWNLRTNTRSLHQMMHDCFKSNRFTKRPIFSQEHIDLGLMIDKTMETLILHSLVVDKQPPQVMKTNTRFGASVRFLGGNKLSSRLVNPTVYCTILSESRARYVIRKHHELREERWLALEHQLKQEHDYESAQEQHYNLQQAQLNQPIYSHLPLDMIQQPAGSPSQTVIRSAHPQQQDQFFQQQQQQQQFYMSPSPHPYQQQQQLAHVHHQPEPQRLTPSATASSSRQSNKNEKDDNRKDESPYLRHIIKVDPSGDIINGKTNVDFQDTGNQLVWTFRSLQLKKIRRTEKKGTESVMDEKFVCLFDAELRVPESKDTYSWIKSPDISFRLMAVSLPVAVIVHGNQEPHAVATITWHNAFARPDAELFSVPDRVAWSELGYVLSEKFRCYGGRGLSKQNLGYLATKILRRHQRKHQLKPQLSPQQLQHHVIERMTPEETIIDDCLVSWNQFAKETLPEKSFTFWDWFYSLLKLTKDHLSKLWAADKIFGFINKYGCDDLLLTKSHPSFSIEGAPVGTFLLRYSESELGGITVAWVPDIEHQISIEQLQHQSKMEESPTGEFNYYAPNLRCMYQRKDSSSASATSTPTPSPTLKLMHLQPFTSKDLITRSLADRIGDLENLIYLYPDIPKDEAFADYYTPVSVNKTESTYDYVKPILIQKIVNEKKQLSASASSSAAASPLMDTTSTNNVNMNVCQSSHGDSNFMAPTPTSYGHSPNGIYQQQTADDQQMLDSTVYDGAFNPGVKQE